MKEYTELTRKWIILLKKTCSASSLHRTQVISGLIPLEASTPFPVVNQSMPNKHAKVCYELNSKSSFEKYVMTLKSNI